MCEVNAMDYFREISPLASRVSEDIELTKLAYEDLWKTLDDKEREQVIDEALIDPAIVLKYNANPNYVEGRVKGLSKFSWFTKSQLELCGLHEETKDHHPVAPPVERRKKSPCRKGPAPEPPKVTLPLVKRSAIASPPCDQNNLLSRLRMRRAEDRQPLVEHQPKRVEDKPPPRKEEKRGSIDEPLKKGEERKPLVSKRAPEPRIAKPRTPPPPPPAQPAVVISLPVDEVDSIPKTGFDFLDNW